MSGGGTLGRRGGPEGVNGEPDRGQEGPEGVKGDLRGSWEDLRASRGVEEMI